MPVIARCAALLAAHGALTTALYLSLSYAETNVVIYISLLWSVAVDNAEILSLITTCRRLSFLGLLFLDMVAFVLCSMSYTMAPIMRRGLITGADEEVDADQEYSVDYGAAELYTNRLSQVILSVL